MYTEVSKFLLSQPSLEQIVAFRPSLEAQERLDCLLSSQQQNCLNCDERAELEGYLKLVGVIRMLQERAWEKLETQQERMLL